LGGASISPYEKTARNALEVTSRTAITAHRFAKNAEPRLIYSTDLLRIATTALVVLCACHGITPNGAPIRSADAVAIWLTTADETHLLARQPDLHFAAIPEVIDAAVAVIDIDETRRFQQMIGFGAAMTDASAYLINEKMTPANRDALLNDLFGHDGGIGFGFVRVTMGASDFSLRHYSYDDMPAGQTDSALTHFSIDPDRPDKLPLLKRALAINPDLKLVASPWSPPGWMKSTGSLVKGTLLPNYYDAFADYFIRFINAYSAEGVPIYAITLQNEPNFEPENYPGMRLEAAARARVIADHLGPRSAIAGIHTLIWDWDHNWDVPQSPLDVLADAGARRYVQGVAWHCYGGDVSAQGKVHDAFPDKDAYFTECSGGEWSPNFAENLKWTVENLVIGATRNWARGVAMWNLALDEKFGPHLGGCDNCRGVVTIDSRTGTYARNVEYYALGHASKFVRAGATRIASKSSDKSLPNVAFRNPDGTSVLIVLNSGDRERTISIRSRGRSFIFSLASGAVATLTWA
jgi:glucosylceramidase